MDCRVGPGKAFPPIVRVHTMPTAAAVALRSAIHAALVADGALLALLGGAHVYDEPPRNAAFPYVTIGEARVIDWSTGAIAARSTSLRCMPGRARAVTARRI